MANINRARVVWSGWPGGPGLSTFYFDQATTNMAALLAFWTSARTVVPAGVSFNVPNSGDQIDPGTGKIVGTWTGSGGGVTTTTGTAAAYSGTSGCVIRWQTGGILNGRRLLGRTYMVPLKGSMYGNDGSIDEASIASLVTACATLILAYSPNLVAWSKPRNAGTNGPGDPGKASLVSAITSAFIPDLAVVMRSRRV